MKMYHDAMVASGRHETRVLHAALRAAIAASMFAGTEPPLAHAADSDAAPPGDAGEAAICPPPDGTRPDPALIVTDDFVLTRFGLERVLARLVERGRVGRQSAVDLYQRLWDSMDTGANAKFSGPHCDDLVPGSINGFPIDCPRKEARLKDTTPDSFAPVALVNRFDLHAADASDCGEYRIVYAMRPFALENRNLINFEASLPNPHPERGLEGCRPIAEFWQSLAEHDVNTRRGRRQLAQALDDFYFRGIGGVEAVVEPEHYGLSEGDRCVAPDEAAPARGQIRTNMFVDATEATDSWVLRQFGLARACSDDRHCHLEFQPAPVGTNPFPELFDASSTLPEAADFQAAFIDQIETLARDDVPRIAMTFDPRFNAGQSTSSGVGDHYFLHAANGPRNGQRGFVEAIRAELARIGRADLGPTDIVERALTQSCAGCHQLSNLQLLSGNSSAGPVWPETRPPTENTSGGFVHIDENGHLSPALWCSFLPFRRSLLDEFLASPASPSCGAE